MTDEKQMKQAVSTYKTLCTMLETRNWNFEKIEDKLMIKSGIRGNDLPIEFLMVVNPGNMLVTFYSFLPFKVSEDKRVDAAMATTIINDDLADGSFDLNLGDGTLSFRLTSSFRESILGEDLFEYMIMVSAHTVDEYNDKLLMISNGMWTVEQFLEWKTKQSEE